MMRITGTIIFLLSVAIMPIDVHAVQGSGSGTSGPAAAVDKSTNIHYTGLYCSECHERTPRKGAGSFLKYDGDFNELCKCHGYTPGTYIHPVDVVPSEEKREVIPPDLPLRDGKVTCLTCHDIHMQCEEDIEAILSNRRFLRGAPFKKRTDLCFKCHDDKKYGKHNPHKNQLDDNGEIVVQKCLYCHEIKPDEMRASFEEIKLVGDPLQVCQRCHMKSARHPADANHIVVPSQRIMSRMITSEKQFNVIFPLDYDGKIFCGTCHNPHQRGVIPSENIGAMGTIEMYGQRFHGKICIACHER